MRDYIALAKEKKRKRDAKREADTTLELRANLEGLNLDPDKFLEKVSEEDAWDFWENLDHDTSKPAPLEDPNILSIGRDYAFTDMLDVAGQTVSKGRQLREKKLSRHAEVGSPYPPVAVAATAAGVAAGLSDRASHVLDDQYRATSIKSNLRASDIAERLGRSTFTEMEVSFPSDPSGFRPEPSMPVMQDRKVYTDEEKQRLKQTAVAIKPFEQIRQDMANAEKDWGKRIGKSSIEAIGGDMADLVVGMKALTDNILGLTKEESEGFVDVAERHFKLGVEMGRVLPGATLGFWKIAFETPEDIPKVIRAAPISSMLEILPVAKAMGLAAKSTKLGATIAKMEKVKKLAAATRGSIPKAVLVNAAIGDFLPLIQSTTWALGASGAIGVAAPILARHMSQKLGAKFPTYQSSVDWASQYFREATKVSDKDVAGILEDAVINDKADASFLRAEGRYAAGRVSQEGVVGVEVFEKSIIDWAKTEIGSDPKALKYLEMMSENIAGKVDPISMMEVAAEWIKVAKEAKSFNDAMKAAPLPKGVGRVPRGTFAEIAITAEGEMRMPTLLREDIPPEFVRIVTNDKAFNKSLREMHDVSEDIGLPTGVRALERHRLVYASALQDHSMQKLFHPEFLGKVKATLAAMLGVEDVGKFVKNVDVDNKLIELARGHLNRAKKNPERGEILSKGGVRDVLFHTKDGKKVHLRTVIEAVSKSLSNKELDTVNARVIGTLTSNNAIDVQWAKKVGRLSGELGPKISFDDAVKEAKRTGKIPFLSYHNPREIAIEAGLRKPKLDGLTREYVRVESGGSLAGMFKSVRDKIGRINEIEGTWMDVRIHRAVTTDAEMINMVGGANKAMRFLSTVKGALTERSVKAHLNNFNSNALLVALYEGITPPQVYGRLWDAAADIRGYSKGTLKGDDLVEMRAISRSGGIDTDLAATEIRAIDGKFLKKHSPFLAKMRDKMGDAYSLGDSAFKVMIARRHLKQLRHEMKRHVSGDEVGLMTERGVVELVRRGDKWIDDKGKVLSNEKVLQIQADCSVYSGQQMFFNYRRKSIMAHQGVQGRWGGALGVGTTFYTWLNKAAFGNNGRGVLGGLFDYSGGAPIRTTNRTVNAERGAKMMAAGAKRSALIGMTKESLYDKSDDVAFVAANKKYNQDSTWAVRAASLDPSETRYYKDITSSNPFAPFHAVLRGYNSSAYKLMETAKPAYDVAGAITDKAEWQEKLGEAEERVSRVAGAKGEIKEAKEALGAAKGAEAISDAKIRLADAERELYQAESTFGDVALAKSKLAAADKELKKRRKFSANQPESLRGFKFRQHSYGWFSDGDAVELAGASGIATAEFVDRLSEGGFATVADGLGAIVGLTISRTAGDMAMLAVRAQSGLPFKRFEKFEVPPRETLGEMVRVVFGASWKRMAHEEVVKEEREKKMKRVRNKLIDSYGEAINRKMRGWSHDPEKVAKLSEWKSIAEEVIDEEYKKLLY